MLARGVVVLLACTLALSAAADERLQKLVNALRSEDGQARLAAYNALAPERSAELVGMLVKVLPDCPDLGQYYGILILRQQDPRLCHPALKRLLSASSAHLRVLAAAELCRNGEDSAARVIVEALQDESLSSAERALLLARIYGIQQPSVLGAVRALLQVGEDASVVGAAVYNVYLTRDRDALPALRALDAHADPNVRLLAAGCRLVLSDEAATEPLVHATRAQALTSASLFRLKSLLLAIRPAPGPVLAALAARLETERDVNVQRALVDILGEHGYTRAVAAIRPLLDHENAALAKSAFEALSSMPGALTPATLRELLVSGDDARRLAAAEALRRADDTRGFDEVVRILREGKRINDRWEAASVLAGFRSGRSVEPLLLALADENVTVRANACNSLGAVLRTLFPYRRFDVARTGYVATADAATRSAAVARLRAWWAGHATSDW